MYFLLFHLQLMGSFILLSFPPPGILKTNNWPAPMPTGSRRGGPQLFSDKTKARRAAKGKTFLRPAPPYLWVWMTSAPPPPPATYLKVWIRHWIQSKILLPVSAKVNEWINEWITLFSVSSKKSSRGEAPHDLGYLINLNTLKYMKHARTHKN